MNTSIGTDCPEAFQELGYLLGFQATIKAAPDASCWRTDLTGQLESLRAYPRCQSMRVLAPRCCPCVNQKQRLSAQATTALYVIAPAMLLPGPGREHIPT